jgi:hypothetical protein
MKHNVGATDRRIRVLLGLAFIILFFYFKCWVCAILGAILIVTAAIGWCGLYQLFGINTCKLPKQ